MKHISSNSRLEWVEEYSSSAIMANKTYICCNLRNSFGSYKYYICEMPNGLFHLGFIAFDNSIDFPRPSATYNSLEAAKKCSNEHFMKYFFREKFVDNLSKILI
jgi:hypothetical protein